jgi:hypothetical protein
VNLTHLPTRYRAVSMELAAYLDGRYVEMHILTDTGESIVVACPKDSIFAIQRHIERIGRECPEIATWSRHRDPNHELSGQTPFSRSAMLPRFARQSVLDRVYAVSARRTTAGPEMR